VNIGPTMDSYCGVHHRVLENLTGLADVRFNAFGPPSVARVSGLAPFHLRFQINEGANRTLRRRMRSALRLCGFEVHSVTGNNVNGFSAVVRPGKFTGQPTLGGLK
jgi:hypothetical protein